MDEQSRAGGVDTGESSSFDERISLEKVTTEDIDRVKDDLVKAILQRAKLVETDAHSSHGNTHSSNNSAGAI